MSKRPKRRTLPTREDQIKALKSQKEPYDVLIIGGGATGAGCALDACTRGNVHFQLIRFRNPKFKQFSTSHNFSLYNILSNKCNGFLKLYKSEAI